MLKEILNILKNIENCVFSLVLDTLGSGIPVKSCFSLRGCLAIGLSKAALVAQ